MNTIIRKPASWGVALLLIAVTAGILVLRGRADPNPPGNKDVAPAPSADQQRTDAEAPVKATEARNTEVVNPPTAKEPEAAKATADPKANPPPKAAEDRRFLLETIGTLVSTHCYQTYLNIGLVADSKAKGNYSEKDAYRVLDTVLSLLETVDRKLVDLAKVDLDKADRDSLEQIRKLSFLLRSQGKALQSYWETNRDEDAAKYEDVRKDSWAAISRVLGIGK
jgi:hypothetical protein